jgi:hypothetical protein
MNGRHHRTMTLGRSGKMKFIKISLLKKKNPKQNKTKTLGNKKRTCIT